MRIRLWLCLLSILCGRPACAQQYGGGFARFLGYEEDRARAVSSEQFGDRGPFIERQEFQAASVVARGADSRWTVDGRAGLLGLGSPNVVLPDTGVTVPRDLWNLQAGAGYAKELGERRRWGARLALGSASDEPFLTWRDDEVFASAYYQLPSGERNSWVLLLNYSNNRPFLNNTPLPGFAYIITDPERRLDVAVGFPFIFARWRPEGWTLSAGTFGGVTYSLEAARRLAGPFSAYGRVERQPLQWLRAGRTGSTDRLIFDSSRAVLGIRAEPSRQVSLELSGGRAFNLRFFEARDARHAGSASRAALSNAWLLRASLTWSWGERRAAGKRGT